MKPARLAPPVFPPWQTCDVCGERLALIVNGLKWCTSAACDPHGRNLTALDGHFRKWPTTIVKGENDGGR
jgi:hypothetical protein